MTRNTKASLLFSAALVLWASSLPTPLAARADGGDSESIGFIELEGIGRFDIHPIQEGAARSSESSKMLRFFALDGLLVWRSRQPGVRWGAQNPRPARCETTPAGGRSGWSSSYSTAVTVSNSLNPAASPMSSPSRPVHDRVVAGNRCCWTRFPSTGSLWKTGVRWRFKLTFEGSARRQTQTGNEPASDVLLKGVLEVEGLPYVEF